jgi:futalosine hydrolase
MSTVLINAATPQELTYLVRELDATLIPFPGTGEVWRGTLATGRLQIVLATTGIGKVNTAWALTALLEHHLEQMPALIINTGCGGSYSGSGLNVGDLAVANAEVYGDEGVETPRGWQSMEAIGIPVLVRKDKLYFNEFPLSQEAAEKAMRLAAVLGIPMQRGRFVTVSTCSGTAVRGKKIAGRFSGICENMEGAVVAHLALKYEIPCMEVRGISNLVEDRDLSRWNITLAVETAQRFLLRYLESIEESLERTG